MTNSGKKANKSGNRLEEFVESHLTKEGYIEFKGSHKHDLIHSKSILAGKWFAKQAIVDETIYRTIRKCDFLVFNKDKFPDFLIIECKWQASPGSVDEKYPFLIFNIMKSGIDTVILIDGGGYKKAAIVWLKSMTKTVACLIDVCNMAEFQKKINNDFF